MAADIKNIEASPAIQWAREVMQSNHRQPTPNDTPTQRLDVVPRDSKALDKLVERLRDYVQSMDREVQFSVDETSGYTVIKVIDAQSQKVIRQIPAEVTLRLARRLGHGASSGLLFTDRA